MAKIHKELKAFIDKRFVDQQITEQPTRLIENQARVLISRCRDAENEIAGLTKLIETEQWLDSFNSEEQREWHVQELKDKEYNFSGDLYFLSLLKQEIESRKSLD